MAKHGKAEVINDHAASDDMVIRNEAMMTMVMIIMAAEMMIR